MEATVGRWVHFSSDLFNYDVEIPVSVGGFAHLGRCFGAMNTDGGGASGGFFRRGGKVFGLCPVWYSYGKIFGVVKKVLKSFERWLPVGGKYVLVCLSDCPSWQ
jgi:hypothetical protein